MSRYAFILFILLFAVKLPADEAQEFQADAAGFQRIVAPFLAKHCLRCHGPKDPQGEFRTDRDLTLNFTDAATKGKWSEVVDVLNAHEMPPEKEPQPEPGEVAGIVDWVTQQAALAEQFRRLSTPVLRRLNRNEYRNCIRDLLGVDVDVSIFPNDPLAGGFDTNGSALNLSSSQIDLYYETARRIIVNALQRGPRPRPVTWLIEPESGDNDRNRVAFAGQKPIVNGGESAVQDGCRVLRSSEWNKAITVREFILPYPGTYRLRILAGAKVPARAEVVVRAEKLLKENMDNHLLQSSKDAADLKRMYEKNIVHLKTDRMYDYGPPRIRVTRILGGQPVVVGETDITADFDARKDYDFEISFTTEKAGIKIEYAYSIPKVLENFAIQNSEEFARPEAWIDRITLEGPINEKWPPEQYTRLMLGDDRHPVGDRMHAEKVLRTFMRSAYRRPITEDELKEKLALFDAAVPTSASFEKAITEPLVAVLMSPQFLFLSETTAPGSSLNDFELASRLSFFLWSSQPDQELMKLAAESRLHDHSVLISQIDRMLADPKSEQFVENFAGQWLGLSEFGANPPAADLYPQYDRHLETSSIGESVAFFREVLHSDLGVLNFIDSDFVVINERLARFYGIDGVRGDHFRRVPVPSGVVRGGVMSQASVLMLTSNGTRTSPVKRGTWVLKNILGTDPGLPVANAGEIAPSVPGIGKATVRQRLEIHRELAQCARCHNKIDPLGFALENFDASGAWREKEGFGYKGRIDNNDPDIDASSRMPDGQTIIGLSGLRKALRDKSSLFIRCLTEKLFTYSLGRELSLSDAATVELTIKSVNSSDPTLKELIRAIAASKLFLTR